MSDILSQLKEKKLFVAPVAVILVLLILRIVLLHKPSSEINYTVKRENLVDSVQVSGTYKAASQVTVVSPANGIISQLYVANGDSVEKGDPLFHVDSTATTDEQQAAYTNYQSALSALQTAQNNVESLDATMWTKQQAYISAQNTQNYMNNHTTNPATNTSYTDLEKDAINNGVSQSQKDFQAAEQAYKTAGVAVSAAQAKVTQTRQLYAETQSTTVTAPAAGTIVNLQNTIGDAVSAPQTLNSASGQTLISSTTSQPVLVIANLSHPYITVSVSEDYAARISPGQKASIIFDSLKDKTFKGTVQSIDTVGTDTNGVITYSARIIAPAISSNIKPGMTALITIETLRRENVLTVPNSAVINKEDGTYVENARTRKLMPVTIGIKGIAKTVVTNGVDEGTVIVANPTGT